MLEFVVRLTLVFTWTEDFSLLLVNSQCKSYSGSILSNPWKRDVFLFLRHEVFKYCWKKPKTTSYLISVNIKPVVLKLEGKILHMWKQACVHQRLLLVISHELIDSNSFLLEYFFSFFFTGKITDICGNPFQYNKEVKHMNSAGVLATLRNYDYYASRIPNTVKESLVP